MKLNNDVRCLVETLANRVMDFNENSKVEKAVIHITEEGIYLFFNFDHWEDESGIYATTRKQLENMIQWLDEKLAIEQKDEIDPKAEAQRELDKEQI
jgi:hypothetical protein